MAEGADRAVWEYAGTGAVLAAEELKIEEWKLEAGDLGGLTGTVMPEDGRTMAGGAREEGWVKQGR